MAVRVESLVGPDELFFVDFAVSFVIGFKYTPWHAMRQATCARMGRVMHKRQSLASY